MKTAFLSTLILALSTIRKFLSSVPGQDLYSSVGSFFACLMSAETTVWVSLPANLANIT